MKTTDNTTKLNLPYGQHIVLSQRETQYISELQTELGNTQFALEEMAAQRDAALAALRDIIRYSEQPMGAIESHAIWAQARAVIAASQGGAQ